ncbi:hypothetical protein R1sor_009507 [Riccia sorocarpa]|uniref:Reverse transcriptase domain-containing protein n=1 Tax=Riccia sorocarpa TaxID=122646 RepID=A0ABD3HWV3_9MARC
MKLIYDTEEEWILAAEQLIKSVRGSGLGTADRRTWNLQEILLLGGPKRIPNAPTVTGILEAWHSGKLKLKLPPEVEIGRDMKCHQYLRLGRQQGWWSEADLKTCLQQTTRLRIETMNEWAQWLERRWETATIPNEEATPIRIGLSANLSTMTVIPIQELDWIIKITHDSRARLSDHRPVHLRLLHRNSGEGRKGTYFKFSTELTTEVHVKEQMQRMWKEGGVSHEDLRKNWDWKWANAKQILIQVDKERREQRKIANAKLEELNRARIRVADSRTNSLDDELERIEAEIATLEKAQEATWRKWSNFRWIKEEDLPSNIFFAILKARRAKEDITVLQTEDGRRSTKEDDIMKEIHRFYSNLYRKEDLSDNDRRAMESVLSGIQKKASREQNQELIRIPTDTEIQELIESLPKGKAPGLDGMTPEALRELGDTAEHDVKDFIWEFWILKGLTWKQQSGVIKLIPKEGDRLVLKNWRPISLLN